ncbi:MAG: T9SS type A sorting domain-containing protein [Bacteroidetes bacterium]|jgi:polyhydroxybutyrate depolymerase|nr:T9SS type A sorting domain-containing protein [Bacteroidota bacterium]
MRATLFLIAGFISAGLAAHAQQNVLDSLEHQGFQRKYIVHIPPDYTEGNATPLVLTLHGGSGNFLNVQGFTQMNPISNQFGFISVYPQGYAESPIGGFTWADGRGTVADRSNIDDVGFIVKLIDTLAADFSIDKDKVYICGFSNGGFMTQRLACEKPEPFAAIGSLGCSMDTNLIQTCNPNQAVPMAFFSGTADPEVPYTGGAMNNPTVTPIVAVDTAVQFWVANNNCQQEQPVVNIHDTVPGDSSTVELFKYTDCDCNADFYFYKIINGGHTWPGVPLPQLPQLGNTNEDIHGSYVLWNFFSDYSLCSTTSDASRQIAEQDIKVFPNPFAETVHIESNREIKDISVYDAMGNRRWFGKNTPLQLNLLPSGMYFLHINFNDEGVKTAKVIKK